MFAPEKFIFRVECITAATRDYGRETVEKKVNSNHFKSALSPWSWEVLWNALSLATRSTESLAAFTARVFGITSKELANSAIASCSLELWREKITTGLLSGQLGVERTTVQYPLKISHKWYFFINKSCYVHLYSWQIYQKCKSQLWNHLGNK